MSNRKQKANGLPFAKLYVGSKKEKEKEIPNDIVKEYGLIQQKKSNLSKSQRDWIVWKFEKNFKRVSLL